MRILFVGNMNGRLDEGMRNVSTHLVEGLKESCTVVAVGLRDVFGSRLPADVDAVVLGARAKARTLLVAWRLRLRYPRTPMVLLAMQPVTDGFKRGARLCGLGLHYVFFSAVDRNDFSQGSAEAYPLLDVGLDQEKFHAASPLTRQRLREAAGVLPDEKVVLHVGHCSQGRGLESFLSLGNTLRRWVVTSGLFEDGDLAQRLRDAGVKVESGYLADIETRYQMADVYLFPTTRRDSVIAVPLSVLEALACGVPVVAVEGIASLAELTVADPRYLRIVSADQVSAAVAQAAELPVYGASLIPDHPTWQAVSLQLFGLMLQWVEENR